MKRRIVLSLALALIAISVSLIRSDSTVNAQNQIRTVADTGVITLGPNQALHLSILSGTPTANGTFSVRQIGYSQGGMGGVVSRLSARSQTTTSPVTLMPGEAASIVVDPQDPSGNTYVRALVLSNSRNAKVNAMIIDTITGNVVAFTTDLVIDVSG